MSNDPFFAGKVGECFFYTQTQSPYLLPIHLLIVDFSTVNLYTIILPLSQLFWSVAAIKIKLSLYLLNAINLAIENIGHFSQLKKVLFRLLTLLYYFKTSQLF